MKRLIKIPAWIGYLQTSREKELEKKKRETFSWYAPVVVGTEKERETVNHLSCITHSEDQDIDVTRRS